MTLPTGLLLDQPLELVGSDGSYILRAATARWPIWAPRPCRPGALTCLPCDWMKRRRRCSCWPTAMGTALDQGEWGNWHRSVCNSNLSFRTMRPCCWPSASREPSSTIRTAGRCCWPCVPIRGTQLVSAQQQRPHRGGKAAVLSRPTPPARRAGDGRPAAP